MLFPQSLPKPNTSKAPPAFYRLRDVMRISARSRSTVYRDVSEGRFPAPVLELELELELTRFRGHFIVQQKGVREIGSTPWSGRHRNVASIPFAAC